MEFRYDNGFGTHFASSFQIHRELKDKGMFPKTSGLRNLMNEQLEWGGGEHIRKEVGGGRFWSQ